jgi:hypothetical protein
MLAMYLCAGLSVVVYQYSCRRWQRAVLLAVAGLAATVVVPQVWPWSFARAEGREPGAWAAEATAVHDPAWGAESAIAPERGTPRRHITARVTLSGAPPEITVASTGVRGRLLMPDGTVIESGQGGGYSAPFRNAALEAALGGVRLLSAQEERVQELTPVIALTEDELSRYGGRSGRIDAEVYFMVLRTRVVASMPLTQGAAYDDGLSRVEITAVRRWSGGRDVTFRQWRSRPLLPDLPEQSRWLVLRNRARGEAIWGTSVSVRATSVVGSVFTIPRALVGGRGPLFTAGTGVFRFPDDADQMPPLDPTWFDEAELVVLRSELVGVVTKLLTIEELVIPES